MAERLSMSLPNISEADVAVVAGVLRSRRLALGPYLDAFEESVAEYVGVEHAVAVSSGTAALHLILVALGIGPGDEVIVPSFTFVATANAVLFTGAKVVFADIEPVYMTIDADDAMQKVTASTRAIIAVDAFGHPAELDRLEVLCVERGITLIDDSCEALGAAIGGRRVGSFGSASAFAFYPNKQLTVGEGGMILTDDPKLASALRSLRNQGRSTMAAWLVHERLGYNYRLDEMSAALGWSQMQRIETLLSERDAVAAMYNEQLPVIGGLTLQRIRPSVRMSWFVYVVLLPPAWNRDDLMVHLDSVGIPSRAYFRPVHQQPYAQALALGQCDLPVTNEIASRTIALPFHGAMTGEDVHRVCDALGAFGQGT